MDQQQIDATIAALQEARLGSGGNHAMRAAFNALPQADRQQLYPLLPPGLQCSIDTRTLA